MKNVYRLFFLINIFLILTAFSGLNKTRLKHGNNLYEIQYPANWEVVKKTLVKNHTDYEIDNKNLSKENNINLTDLSFRNTDKGSQAGIVSLGDIDIYFIEKKPKESCSSFYQKNKEISQFYKKDKQLVNGKKMEKWIKESEEKNLKIFFSVNDTNCVLFELISATSSAEEFKKIQNDFYKIINSFHMIKN